MASGLYRNLAFYKRASIRAAYPSPDKATDYVLKLATENLKGGQSWNRFSQVETNISKEQWFTLWENTEKIIAEKL
jgi:hypothetical protein